MSIDPHEWLGDAALQGCSPATRGVWVNWRCAMHQAEQSYTLMGTVESLARVGCCDDFTARTALAELSLSGVAEVEREGSAASNKNDAPCVKRACNADVTRMKRECNAPDSGWFSGVFVVRDFRREKLDLVRENTANRVRRCRAKSGINGQANGAHSALALGLGGEGGGFLQNQSKHSEDEEKTGRSGPKSAVTAREGCNGHVTLKKRACNAHVTPAKLHHLYWTYPRHVGRDAAMKAIRAAIGRLDEETTGGADPVDWLEGRVAAYAASRIVRTSPPQFIPHPATWFRQGRYADEDGAWDVEYGGTVDPGAKRREAEAARLASLRDQLRAGNGSTP